MPRAIRGSGAPGRRAITVARPAPGERPARVQPATAVAEAPGRAMRFHIFIVDTGWDSTAHRVLKQNFWLIRELQKNDPIYVLGREKSIEYMRYHYARIGHDPIIAVHDLAAMRVTGANGFHGFRLRLGLLHTRQQALMALQNFSRFLISHRDSTRLEQDIRTNLRREGLAGAIEIVLKHEAREIGA